MATPERELGYGAVEIFNKETLGVGSYGKVCKAKCGQLPCAAKLLHDTMFGTNDPGVHRFVERFEQECQFLRAIKHPNIVQFLGTSRDPRSRRLALLMELMDESLTRFLERSTGPLPYHTQLNICHDVALALAYLHSNDIIHRDLSSNNVLLIGEGSRAKVTDFGMSKLVGLNPRMTPLTMCPGTSAYMPPEALITPPRYSSKLDCFSHGVLTIQVATGQFPDPGDAHVQDPDEGILRQVPENERRKKDIELVKPDHPLLPLALHCLKLKASERPLADELCGRLATLKCEPKYTHSVEQSREHNVSLQTLQQQISERDDELERVRAELKSKESTVEQVIADCQAELETNKKHYESMIEQLRNENPRQKQEHHIPSRKRPEKTQVSLKLTWRQGAPAPENLNGAVTVHGNIAYFSMDYSVYSFTLSEDKWTKLTPCQYKSFAMAVVNDKLTTIGGRSDNSSAATNTLLCLSERKAWRELLPPMPTHRLWPAAVTTSIHLVVAGGRTGSSGLFKFDHDLRAVEILNLDTLQWSSASSSPEALAWPTMTLCGGHFYLSNHSTVFSCSVERLLTSAPNNNGSVWTRLADIPVPTGTSLTTLKGHVLAIGGRNRGNPTGAIHCYDAVTNSWSVIGEMPTPRSEILVAVLPSNELIVVGGRQQGSFMRSLFNITEIAQPQDNVNNIF